jgi:hypothetical protein
MADNIANPIQPAPPQPVQTPTPINQPVYPPGMTAPPQTVYQQAAPPQTIYTAVAPAPQMVVYQQPVAAPQTAENGPVQTAQHDHPQIILVSHSSLFYWWPVWAVGYLMAFLTLIGGQDIPIGDHHEGRFYPANYMGVVFIFTLFMVILISNITLRGLASALVVTGAALFVVVIAYFGLWDSILGWLGSLNVFLNEGAYFWFSTLMFLVWAFTTFVFDRMSYWRVEAGQISHVHVFGASTKSYDTENMTFEKRRDDVFRHWLLGMGSGDLIIHAFNAGEREKLEIPNVLFIGRKIKEIQHMIATQPSDADETKRG